MEKHSEACRSSSLPASRWASTSAAGAATAISSRAARANDATDACSASADSHQRAATRWRSSGASERPSSGTSSAQERVASSGARIGVAPAMSGRPSMIIGGWSGGIGCPRPMGNGVLGESPPRVEARH